MMRSFLQIASFVVFALATVVGSFYLLKNLALQEKSLEAWLPVLVALPSMMFSAALWILVDIANAMAPTGKITLEKLFPERSRKSSN